MNVYLVRLHENASKQCFRQFVLYKSTFSNILVFLIRELSNNKKVPISVHYFSSSRFMPIFILVGKVVLSVCIKSTLIMSCPARTINKSPHEHSTLLGDDSDGVLKMKIFLPS